MKKLGLVFCLGFAVLGMGCRHQNPEQHAEKMVERISHKLELQEAQKSKLEEVKTLFLTAEKKNREAHQKSEEMVRKMILSDQLDKQQLLTFAEGRSRVFKDDAPQLIDKISEFHAMLSADQKAQLVQMLDHLKKHRRHKRR